MAVELPRINRAQPQAPQPSQKLDVNLPNIAEATAPIGHTISNSTEKVVDAFSDQQKKQQQVWDIKTTDINNTFERALKNRLSEIKLKTGDTTKDFVDYEDFAQKTHDELLSSFNDNDPEFKTLLSEKMLNTFGRMKSFKDDQQYEQFFKFQNEASDARVKLDVDNAFTKGMSLDIKRPDTFTSFDAYIKRIEQTRISQGDRTGMTVRDENGPKDAEGKGTPKHFSGPVGVLIRKDVGDTVVPLVKSLNAAGKVVEGKEVLRRYSNYLNAADKTNLLNDNNEADVKNQAIIHLADMRKSTKDGDIRLSDIDKMSDISEPIRFKMKELNQIEVTKKTQERDRFRENFMDSEYNRLIYKQTSTAPYATDAEYINSPEGKNAASSLAPEQFERMRKVAFAPVKSTVASLSMMNNGDKDSNLFKMSAEDRIKMYAGLSNEDRDIAREIMRQQSIDAGRRSDNSELTGSTASQAKGAILKNIEEQLQANELFQYNSRRKTFGNEEYVQNMIKQYSAVIQNDILMAGKKAGDANTQDTIMSKRLKQMVNQYKKDESDTSWFSSNKFKGVSNEAKSSRYPFDGKVPKPKVSLPSSSGANKLQPTKTTSADNTTASVTAPVEAVNKGLPDKKDRKSWNKIYREVNGVAPTNVDDFNKFIDENIKNK